MNVPAAVRSAVHAAAVRCRIDARRPASWTGLAGAAGVAAFGERWPAEWWPAVPILAGAFSAAAAIGGPPRDVPGAATAWVAARTGWPLAGVVVAVAVGLADPAFATVAVAAALATAAVVALAVERSASPGEAASVPLVAACVAAAAAGFVRVMWPAACGAAAVAGVTAWAAVVVGTAFASKWLTGEALGDVVPAAGILMFGAIGRLWLHAAMLTALAGMVAWLLLAPQSAWCYTLLAAGWCAGAALPLATLGPGSAGEASRRRLTATAVRGAAWWRLVTATGPTAGATALATTGMFAAILGWPPLVAALIAGPGPAWGEHLLVAAALGCVAVTTAAIAAVVATAGGTRDTAHAVALAVALAAVAAAAEKSVRDAGSPRTPGRTAVERSAGSCNTPSCSPRHGGPVSCLDSPASACTAPSPSASPGC